MVRTLNIKRYSDAGFLEVEDSLIQEYRVNIFVNDEAYISLMCLPEHYEELAVGFLFSEQVIGSYEDIVEINSTCTGNVFVSVKNERIGTGLKKAKNRVVVSGCGQGSVNLSFLNEENLPALDSSIKVAPSEILKIMVEFSKQSQLFQKTGGVHSSALVLGEGENLFYEDIGRHNAIDKIVGTALIKGLSIENGILLTSGRISSEILIKTAKLGIPVLVSHSAPTDMAVEIARKIDMTLIGFTRGTRFNVYSGDFRLLA